MSRAPRLVTLVPLLGPFHTRFPRYNAVHVRNAVAAAHPDAVALAPLPPGALNDPGWQATQEIALPLTVVPWAQRSGVPLYGVGHETEGAAAEEARLFERYLSEFSAGRERLRAVEAALEPVRSLMQGALDLPRVLSQLLPAIGEYQAKRRELYGEGPGTGWLEERSAGVAERALAIPAERVALLVGVDDLGSVRAALEERLGAEEAVKDVALKGGDQREARERALLDVALRGDVQEPSALIAQLRNVPSPESRYLQADLLLAHGHAAEALELLEELAAGDFQEPYYLPGFLLTRLGQLYDLAGQRSAALRSYRGALALSFAPPEAAAAARAGIDAAFEWPAREGEPDSR